MPTDAEKIYTHDAHFLLMHWSAWARGNQLHRKPLHVLARLIRERIDDDYTPGHVDLVGEFTPELEAVDKAVARLLDEDIRLRRVVMKYYMRGMDHVEIGREMRLREGYVRGLHLRALDLVHDHARIIYQGLTVAAQ